MIHHTRIAPSPTGDMHLGTARTGYFNWLAARASGGRFILRIDDTDKKRNQQEHVDVILQTMDWLGIDYDELHYQSDRFELYNLAAQRLVENGWATVLENGAIALSENANKHIPDHWIDNIADKIIVSDKEKEIINGSILIKGDKTPSYNFATAFDDLTMNITHVIRGHDHISNTAKQLTMMNILKTIYTHKLPTYTHVGLIYANKKKLSKRDGAASLLKAREVGYDPDALLNFMLRLGWAETDGRTIKMIPKDMAINIFLKCGKMRNQPSNMDLGLLNSMNRRYKSKMKQHSIYK